MNKNLTLIIFIFFISLFSFPHTASAGTTIGVSPNVMSLTNGLVGYWSFDGNDVVNGVIRDKSGNGNHGNAINIASSTFYTQGKLGQGGKFDGGDDVVNVSNDPSFKPTGAMTISVWLKGKGSSATTGSLGTQGGSSTRGYSFGINNSNDVAFTIATSSTETISLTVNDLHNNDIWNHYVAVFTPSVSLEIYKNGVSIGQNTTGIPLAQYVSNGRDLHIGERGNNDTRFNGIIDDVRIYNRALSASEVKQLYMQGAGTKLQETQALRPNVNSLDSGLVGYWTFNNQDIRNGVILDKSGNGNHGNPIGIASSTFYTQGKLGQAGRFDGTNDYVNAGTPSSLNNLSAMSISAWVNAKSFGGTSLGGIVEKSTGFDANGWEFYIRSTLSGTIEFNVDYDVTNLVVRTSSATFSTSNFNKWVHLVVTWDGSTTATNVHIYKDGVEQTYSTQTDGDASRVTDVARNMIIGNNVAGGSRVFDGSIDDVRIYNRALSTSEIKQLYMQGAGTKLQETQALRPNVNSLDSGLVGYWTFNNQDIRNGVILDKSGNGNNGNLINISTSTFYTQGKLGQGGRFDGTNDYVNAGTPSSLNDLPAITISSWVYPKSSGSNNTGYIMEKSTGFGLNGWFLSIDSAGSSGILTPWFYRDYDGATNLSRVVSTVNAIPLNKWTYFTMTWDGTADATGIKFYINGVETAYTSPTDGVGNIVSDTTSSAHIGANVSANSRNFNGSLDDVRIYNRALSASEVQQLYNMGR